MSAQDQAVAPPSWFVVPAIDSGQEFSSRLFTSLAAHLFFVTILGNPAERREQAALL